MPRILTGADLGQIKDPDEFSRQASQVIKEAVDNINGKLEFDKNMNTQTVSVTFPSANTDVAVTHNLMKTDVHYLKSKSDVDCSVYDGAKANTLNTVYLRSTQKATVTLILH